MRYMAQRVPTGEWLHREVPLTGVERTKVLSGPSGITATLQPELRDMVAPDGLHVFEEWGTYLYSVDDNGKVGPSGIVTDIGYVDDAVRLTVTGFTGYPHGYIYEGVKNWGPIAGSGTIANPEVPRPDPVHIVRDLWDWMQDQPDSDLGVTLIGDLSSTARVGSYEEPFRLRFWETPDIGQTIDGLAQTAPFEFVEEHEMLGDGQIAKRLRLGVPRLGTDRGLRFAIGENVELVPEAQSTGSDFGNHVIGIGNGEGRKMVRSVASVRDGRLRRPKIVTDKTVKRQAQLDRIVARVLAQASRTLDVTTLAVKDTPSTPISAIELGDDILVKANLPSYGDFEVKVRVLSITEGDAPGRAVLNTQRSSAFLYRATTEVT